MTKSQEKLIESYIRTKVKSMLKEDDQKTEKVRYILHYALSKYLVPSVSEKAVEDCLRGLKNVL